MMDLTSFVKVVNREELRVYEKFVCSSRHDPYRGTYVIAVVGRKSAADSWIASYKETYPTAGYGTMFTVVTVNTVETDTAGDSMHIEYTGNRYASCD